VTSDVNLIVKRAGFLPLILFFLIKIREINNKYKGAILNLPFYDSSGSTGSNLR
jgi:hypothetical protein